MNIHIKSLMPQQVMSPASALVTRYDQSAGQPMHHIMRAKRKGGENRQRAVEIEMESRERAVATEASSSPVFFPNHLESTFASRKIRFHISRTTSKNV